jgi:hypothetical protein
VPSSGLSASKCFTKGGSLLPAVLAKCDSGLTCLSSLRERLELLGACGGGDSVISLLAKELGTWAEKVAASPLADTLVFSL